MPDDTTNVPQNPKVNRIDIESDELLDFQVPSFVNHINIWSYGSDVYLDMVLVTVEQMDNIKPGATVNEAVYDRYVMSPLTFEYFFQRLSTVREQLKKQGLIT